MQGWSPALKKYLASRETLKHEIERKRVLARVPVTLPDGSMFTLSPSGQNPLIKSIIEQFCPAFAPGGVVLYIGDTENMSLSLVWFSQRRQRQDGDSLRQTLTAGGMPVEQGTLYPLLSSDAWKPKASSPASGTPTPPLHPAVTNSIRTANASFRNLPMPGAPNPG